MESKLNPTKSTISEKDKSEAKRLMSIMGFDEEEEKFVLDSPYFLKKLLDDPQRYDKEYFRMMVAFNAIE